MFTPLVFPITLFGEIDIDILRNANKLTFCLCELCEKRCLAGLPAIFVPFVLKTVFLNTKFTKIIHKGHKVEFGNVIFMALFDIIC